MPVLVEGGRAEDRHRFLGNARDVREDLLPRVLAEIQLALEHAEHQVVRNAVHFVVPHDEVGGGDRRRVEQTIVIRGGERVAAAGHGVELGGDRPIGGSFDRQRDRGVLPLLDPGQEVHRIEVRRLRSEGRAPGVERARVVLERERHRGRRPRLHPPGVEIDPLGGKRIPLFVAGADLLHVGGVVLHDVAARPPGGQREDDRLTRSSRGHRHLVELRGRVRPADRVANAVGHSGFLCR